MLRHVSLLAFTDEAAEADRRSVLDGLAALAVRIPTVRAYSFGPDRALVAGNYDLAIVADFDDEDGYRDYAAHPEHRRFVTEVLAPVLRARAAVQYEC